MWIWNTKNNFYSDDGFFVSSTQFCTVVRVRAKQLYLTAYPQKPVDNPVHKTGIITWVSC